MCDDVMMRRGDTPRQLWFCFENLPKVYINWFESMFCTHQPHLLVLLDDIRVRTIKTCFVAKSKFNILVHVRIMTKSLAGAIKLLDHSDFA